MDLFGQADNGIKKKEMKWVKWIGIDLTLTKRKIISPLSAPGQFRLTSYVRRARISALSQPSAPPSATHPCACPSEDLGQLLFFYGMCVQEACRQDAVQNCLARECLRERNRGEGPLSWMCKRSHKKTFLLGCGIAGKPLNSQASVPQQGVMRAVMGIKGHIRHTKQDAWCTKWQVILLINSNIMWWPGESGFVKRCQELGDKGAQ